MGLLDDNDIDEDKIAASIMQEAGFEEDNAVVQEPAVEQEQVGQIATVETNQEVEALEPYREETSELDGEFAAAERRLSKAILYRELIRGSFFDGNSELVSEVEAELKEFVKQQYLALSGKPKETAVAVEKDFSADEIVALKSLAERIIKNAKVLNEKPAPKPPQLQSGPAPKPRAPVPQVKVHTPVVAPAKKPQLQTRKVPQEVDSRPVPKVIRPTETPALKKTQTARAIVPQKLALPTDGSVVEENGQKYRIKYVEMPDIDKYGIMDGGKIRKLGDGQTTMLSNSIQVYKSGGNVHEIFRTIVGDNSNIPGRVPFPSREQMEVHSMNNAVGAASKLPPTLASIVGR